MRVEINLLCDKKEPMERHETSRAVYAIGYIRVRVRVRFSHKWMRQIDGEIIMKLIVSVRSGENLAD